MPPTPRCTAHHLQDMAPYLIREMRSNCSILRPYLDMLPGPEKAVSAYNFPSEYIPYLNAPRLVSQRSVACAYMRVHLNVVCHTPLLPFKVHPPP